MRTFFCLLTAMSFAPSVMSAESSGPSESLTAVESAARRYRIHVYETYRTERAEYDRQIEVARQVRGLATDSTPDKFNAQVRSWFEAALFTEPGEATPDLPAAWVEELTDSARSSGRFVGTSSPDEEADAPRNDIVGALGRALFNAFSAESPAVPITADETPELLPARR